MPVEIKEVVIRAVLNDVGEDKKQESKGTSLEKESIVQECVTQVLKILKKQNRR